MSAPTSESMLELLEPEVRALGYELVDVECRTGRQGLLRLYIDHENGIGLDDCEYVSRRIGAFLDVEDPMPGEYNLEVSSPGLDRVLRTPAHFARFVGQDVQITLQRPLEGGRRRFKGRLETVEDEALTVVVDGVGYRLNIRDIEKARLVPEV